jgi:hypothetical protein
MNFKGLFVNSTTGKTPASVNTPTTEPPYYQDDSHQAQLWLHESLINSGVLSLDSTMFPYKLYDPDISAQLTQLVYMLPIHYGKDVQVQLDISVAETDGDVLQFRKDRGLVVGDKDDLRVKIEFIAMLPNASEPSNFTKESAFTLQSFIHA